MPSAPQRKKSTPHQVAQAGGSPLVVDPRWILKALAITIAFAGLCGYGTLCFLFSQGQWQLVLSPSHEVPHTPSETGLAFTEEHFGADISGQPQLDGWWIPSDLASDPTVLILHGGSGSISDVLPQAKLLHDARLNVLLFDYRGFGHSAGKHPTQASMEQDSAAALNHLLSLRHIPASNVIVFGQGLGASLAAGLCEQHHDVAGLLLENADGDTEARIRQDGRSRLVPVGWLLNERFPLAGRLHVLTTPKLLISFTADRTPPANMQQAADPKMTVEISSPSDTSALHDALRRFLEMYVAQPARIPVIEPPAQH